MRLTSPHTKGKDVRDLQLLLKDNGYYGGKVDSEYGPFTAQAVYRAKHWLGYARPDQIAGPKLVAFLGKKRKRSPHMIALAKKRKAFKKRLGVEILIQAINDIGMKENPRNSNKCAISRWYGFFAAWCAMAVSYWSVQAGSKTFKRGKFEAYVPYIVGHARMGRHNLTVVKSPKSGDYPCFDWDNDGVADHIGVFAEEEHLQMLAPVQLTAAKKQFGKLGKGEFWAIEGNTGIGNDSNGGAVMLRKRRYSDVQVFVHVGR